MEDKTSTVIGIECNYKVYIRKSSNLYGLVKLELNAAFRMKDESLDGCHVDDVSGSYGQLTLHHYQDQYAKNYLCQVRPGSVQL